MILWCGFAPPAITAGTLDIQITPYDNFIAIDIMVVDDGGPGGCDGHFTLRRTAILKCATIDLATFAQQPGTTSTHRTLDTPLLPGRAYCYEVVACSGFTWAFDCGWGLSIAVIAATTLAPTCLGHGRLEGGITFYGCPGEWAGGDVLHLPPGALEYVGTGAEFLLYGSDVVSCQDGRLLDVTQVLPAACAIAVEPSTWSLTTSPIRSRGAPPSAVALLRRRLGLHLVGGAKA